MRIETFFPYRLAVSAEAFSRQLVAVYGREYGLSREEWRLLFLIEDAGVIDSLLLSNRTSLDRVQVSRAASRLEAKGLIVREIPASDRRLRQYAITPSGRDLFRRVFSAVAARADQILGAMSEDDREALLKGVEALGIAAASLAGDEQDAGR
ncbi:MAG: MarR family transcriptional regulator [Fulvimarina manganoxydans]|uniref:MarR family winged helix-turn-helix transcriptional regulator n=1 Tax=Fulvimarina manganoxydans TaxID=937218 RepID=UPI002352D57D|nr:MarR family transcriptional regulator [Fulvimarina manganoxydans]MCK5933846.1 MarR family transcriptional regulator [Fulvimarina manganoxydans]